MHTKTSGLRGQIIFQVGLHARDESLNSLIRNESLQFGDVLGRIHLLYLKNSQNSRFAPILLELTALSQSLQFNKFRVFPFLGAGSCSTINCARPSLRQGFKKAHSVREN